VSWRHSCSTSQGCRNGSARAVCVRGFCYLECIQRLHGAERNDKLGLVGAHPLSELRRPATAAAGRLKARSI